MGTNGFSYNRAARLIQVLPRESRLFQKFITEDQEHDWTIELELLASIFDAVVMNIWVTQNQNKQRSQQSKKPVPIPRPTSISQKQKEQESKALLFDKLKAQQERFSGLDGEN